MAQNLSDLISARIRKANFGKILDVRVSEVQLDPKGGLSTTFESNRCSLVRQKHVHLDPSKVKALFQGKKNPNLDAQFRL